MFCRLHKFIISSAFDTGKPLWPATKRHIAHCSDCSRFQSLCSTMDRRLKTDKAPIENTVTETLGRRVLDDAATQQTGQSSRLIPLRPTLAAAAVIAMIAFPTVVLLLRRSHISRQNQYELAVNSVRDIYASGTLVADHITGDRAALASLVDKPLENEIKNLTADTKSAVRFLIARVDTGATTRQLPN